MNRIVARIGACAVLAWGALLGPAIAQTATPSPAPSPSPRPSPAAFIARAHADLSIAQNSDHGVTARADAAIYQRANMTRIDLLSVSSSSTPIPPLHFTAVLDARTRTVTVWNDQTKRYFVSHLAVAAPRTPAPKATTAPGGLFDGRSPFADLDVLEFDLKMTGHTTTAGIPTTGFAADLTVQRKTSTASVHMVAAMQLADDYGAFPMAASVALSPSQGTAAGQGTAVSLDYAIDALTVTMPPASAFVLPRGYVKATSVFGVLISPGAPSVPTAHPSPRPSPTASVTPTR